MFKIIPAALFFLSFFASLISNAILRRLSIKYKLFLDEPNEQRKFHKKITPVTGGIGISIGIIFSALFLYSFDNNSFNLTQEESSISKNNIVDFSEVNNVYEMKLANNINIKIQRVNEESFMIILPSGEKNIYKVGNDDSETMTYEFNFDEVSKSINDRVNDFIFWLFLFTLLVQFFMAIDDLWNLSPFAKLILQSICVGGLIFFSEIYISNLGNILGFGDLTLGLFGIPFTIFCVVGIMNAFNMIDGINGLCATLCLLCLISLIYIINSNGTFGFYPLVIPVGAIVGFLMYNMGILGDRAVFLGDNGSNALGFLCAWLLIFLSSSENQLINPSTALWLVAIPFVDAVGVILWRVLKKIKILDSQRDHIHHKLLNLNFSEKFIFMILIFYSLVLAMIGIFFNNQYYDMEYLSFYSFIIFWGCYYLIVKQFRENV